MSKQYSPNTLRYLTGSDWINSYLEWRNLTNIKCCCHLSLSYEVAPLSGESNSRRLIQLVIEGTYICKYLIGNKK